MRTCYLHETTASYCVDHGLRQRNVMQYRTCDDQETACVRCPPRWVFVFGEDGGRAVLENWRTYFLLEGPSSSKVPPLKVEYHLVWGDGQATSRQMTGVRTVSTRPSAVTKWPARHGVYVSQSNRDRLLVQRIWIARVEELQRMALKVRHFLRPCMARKYSSHLCS